MLTIAAFNAARLADLFPGNESLELAADDFDTEFEGGLWGTDEVPGANMLFPASAHRDHAPPHFHAIYGEHEAVFEIATGAVIAGQLPRRARVLVADWAAARRAELQQDWDLAVASQPLVPVPPLD